MEFKCDNFGGVEIKVVDFGGSVVPFYKNLGGGKKISLKNFKMGEVGTPPNEMRGGRYF